MSSTWDSFRDSPRTSCPSVIRKIICHAHAPPLPIMRAHFFSFFCSHGTKRQRESVRSMASYLKRVLGIRVLVTGSLNFVPRKIAYRFAVFCFMRTFMINFILVWGGFDSQFACNFVWNEVQRTCDENPNTPKHVSNMMPSS